MRSNAEVKVIKKQDKILILKKEIEMLKAKIEMLDSYINTLKEEYKRVIELRYKYNKTDLEISSIINITKRAVNKRINRALKELETKYKKSS